MNRVDEPTVEKRNRPLSVNPLKNSAPVGAVLAFLGLERSMPLMHGSQGCTAFAKVLFVRHFREPIPVQTTAMDQIRTVMGADDSIVEALATIADKQKPAVIGLATTGLSETQGCDVRNAIHVFRDAHPEHAGIAVVPVNTPDFNGTLESGYAAAVEATLDTLVPEAETAGTRPGRRPAQVNILAGPQLTPGDIEAVVDLVERFHLEPVVVPDISGSLDGHLAASPFTPVTTGGTPVERLATLGDAAATLVIGPSMGRAADLLHQRTGVPEVRFPTLMGLEAVDAFVHTLSLLSGEPVPARVERQRQQLEDAMLDTHFMLGQARVAVAAEPDGLLDYATLLAGLGAEVVAAVIPGRGSAVAATPVREMKIGDLDDFERLAEAGGAELLIGNSHVATVSENLGRPLLRAGFPLYDQLGAYARTRVGYQGTRQTLFDLANALLERTDHVIPPYRSPLGQKDDEEVAHGHRASAAGA